MINVETMGMWAGEVWNALAQDGTLGVKKLKKVTKLRTVCRNRLVSSRRQGKLGRRRE